MNYYEVGVKEILLIRDGWKCFYCKRCFECNMDGWNNMTIDHQFPQSKSNDIANDDIENLVISCKSCNSSKKDQVFSRSEKNVSQKNFIERRTIIRSRDDKWVKDRFNFIEETNRKYASIDNIMKDLAWTDITSHTKKLFDAIQKDNDDFKEPQSKSGKYAWIKFTNSDHIWYYYPETFTLQAYSIHHYEIDHGQVIPPEINETLVGAGYIGGPPEYRCKLMKPFIAVTEGMDNIRKEISLINQTCKPIRKEIKSANE